MSASSVALLNTLAGSAIDTLCDACIDKQSTNKDLFCKLKTRTFVGTAVGECVVDGV